MAARCALLSAFVALLLAVAPTAWAARHASAARAIRSRRQRRPAESGDEAQQSPSAHEEEDAEERKLANLAVLDRLLDSAVDEERQSALNFSHEDDAFLKVVSRLLDLLDAGGEISRNSVVRAAHDPEHLELAHFAKEVFQVADENADGVLDSEEAALFREILRAHIADLFFAEGMSEVPPAVEEILRVLEAHPDGGVEKRQVEEAATSEEHPELLRLVQVIFGQADEDGDGVLARSEAEKFVELLDEALFVVEDARGGELAERE